jgi:hypothetical protein
MFEHLIRVEKYHGPDCGICSLRRPHPPPKNTRYPIPNQKVFSEKAGVPWDKIAGSGSIVVILSGPKDPYELWSPIQNLNPEGVYTVFGSQDDYGLPFRFEHNRWHQTGPAWTKTAVALNANPVEWLRSKRTIRESGLVWASQPLDPDRYYIAHTK